MLGSLSAGLLRLPGRLGSAAPVQQEVDAEETFGPLTLRNKGCRLPQGGMRWAGASGHQAGRWHLGNASLNNRKLAAVTDQDVKLP